MILVLSLHPGKPYLPTMEADLVPEDNVVSIQDIGKVNLKSHKQSAIEVEVNTQNNNNNNKNLITFIGSLYSRMACKFGHFK